MRFRSFDSLNIFRTVAEKMSFTAAGDALNMSKGAVSYQIAKLEDELGVRLFERRHTHIRLTAEGTRLRDAAARHLGHIETVMDEIRSTVENHCASAPIAGSSRGGSARGCPTSPAPIPIFRFKVEPINTKADLQNRALDLSIFWCDPSVEDMDVEVLFKSNTRPLASPETAARVEALGLGDRRSGNPALAGCIRHGSLARLA